MGKFKSSLLTLACSLATSVAWADTVTFTGFEHGSKTVTYSLSGTNAVKSGGTQAGGFATVLNGGATFESYCVDLYQQISFGTPYTDYSNVGSGHVFNNGNAYADLSRLYARAGSVLNAVSEAAFQLAVWEIAYEKTGSVYDLLSGDASFGAAANVLTLASSWLTSLGGAGPTIHVLESGRRQDVIFAPVPEPETYALLMLGLGAVGVVSRRRQRQATAGRAST
jgi:hypothetical protein